MTDAERTRVAVMLLATIVEMSDHAKSMGGSTSISGVAALHRMQTSIQKNRARIMAAGYGLGARLAATAP